MIFSTCCVVAGTKGKQILLKAGETNGTQIKLIKVATPPGNKNTYKLFFNNYKSPGILFIKLKD